MLVKHWQSPTSRPTHWTSWWPQPWGYSWAPGHSCASQLFCQVFRVSFTRPLGSVNDNYVCCENLITTCMILMWRQHDVTSYVWTPPRRPTSCWKISSETSSTLLSSNGLTNLDQVLKLYKLILRQISKLSFQADGSLTINIDKIFIYGNNKG
jgi:hypothetical protein